MRKLFSFVILNALLVGSTVHAADAKEGVNPYGKLLKGEGVEIEMAIFDQKNQQGLNDVLMKVTGAAAHDEGIDGKVLRYTATHGGTGVDFKYKKDGAEFNRMSSRKAWGTWDQMEIYLGDKSISVSVDDKGSKKVKPAGLLAEFKSSTK